MLDGEVKELFEIPVHGLISQIGSVKLSVSLTSTRPERASIQEAQLKPRSYN